MTDLQRPNTASDNAEKPPRNATHEELLAAKLPPQETEQPDPGLQLSVGRVGAGSITLVAVVCAVILAVVLYGLNSPGPDTADSGAPNATSAPAAGTHAPPAH